MLRRKPTAIAITNEDLASFEDTRLRQLAAQENKTPSQSQTQSQHTRGESSASANVDPSDELKPLPGDKARIVRSREERIGVGGAGSGGTRKG